VIVYAVRLLWILAHLLCLIEVWTHRWRYHPLWQAYLGVSAPFAVIYSAYFSFPSVAEIWPNFEESFAGLMVAILLLRTLACLEALHYQTHDRDGRSWSMTNLGAYTLAFGVVLALHLSRDGQWAGLFTEYRRYLQIWIFMVMLAVEWLTLSVGWWRNRLEDWHTAALFSLAFTHAANSLMAMTKHPTGGVWRTADWIATLVDAVVLLCWAIVPHVAQSIERSHDASLLALGVLTPAEDIRAHRLRIAHREP